MNAESQWQIFQMELDVCLNMPHTIILLKVNECVPSYTLDYFFP